jgi:DNA-binding response OmpR family regulator
MVKSKILVVEDDPSILTGVVDLLESEGYAVNGAVNGTEGIELYRRERPDLIILDVMMPGKNGYDVCREIRASDRHIPILMLTAKGQELDKVIGLELGADDYIVKPFGIHELLARIRAALRRSIVQDAVPATAPLLFGNVSIDPSRLQGMRGGEAFDLSRRELQLLRLFLSRDGEVLDRDTILDKVWGVRYEGTTRTLDQHIAKLRQKVEENPADPRFIRTVHGAGYRFRSDGAG